MKLKTTSILIFALLFSGNVYSEELKFEIKNLRAALIKEKDSIAVRIISKTDGWMLVGFNKTNTLEKADFKMFRKGGAGWEASDRKNTGGRNYPTDEKLKGENNITITRDLSHTDQNGVEFKIPLNSNDKNDFNHIGVQEYYLILAWSVSRDWDHHSRERKHFKINWNSEKLSKEN